MAYYLHEVPGRLRIKIPALKKNRNLAWELETLLNSAPGITSVSVNTVTGSVIIYFDPKVVNSRAVLTLLSREGYIDLAKAIPHHQYVDTALSNFGRTASKALLGLVLDRALQGTPFSVLTALI
ncbi:MAG: HMA2 domain-containing protein [Thermodesulfobacteriota bacterium]